MFLFNRVLIATIVPRNYCGSSSQICTDKDKEEHARAECWIDLSASLHDNKPRNRKAWLDKMTMMRLKELNRLTKEDTERIQTLR